jgi:hypothetical protein
MTGHSTQPVGWNQREVLAIKRPFVKGNFDGTAAEQHANHE